MPKFTAYILNWNLAGTGHDYNDPEVTRVIWRKAIQNDLYNTFQVEAEDLDHVFTLLNIDHPANYRFRSMSVGDIVKCEDTGIVSICLPVGWRRLSPELLIKVEEP